MTKPSYLGWAAGSQVTGLAVAPAGYARNVNLNNGNSNWYNDNNRGRALAVLAGECHDPVPFSTLKHAYRRARRRKKPSWDQLAFDATWLDQTLDLQDQLRAGTWHPGTPKVRIVKDPKHRQIHAPPFADRVVHHAIIPPLEALYEPTFIHDNYSNRRGKGLHAAVRRLRQFVREVASGQGGGYSLQVDVKNYYNSIRREKAWQMLKARMQRAGTPEWIQRAVHALLNWPVSRTGVRWACSAAERESVPMHKRLENAPPGCGIAVGNYASQFIGTVYLDPLDQFCKHVLKIPRYLRYVDDIVAVHHDLAQLERWRLEIQRFLRDELGLELKDDQRLRPLQDGIDFLGYVVRPTHTVVRRRVVGHCRARLADFERARDKSPEACERLRSVWASYVGHFRHAATWRLCTRLHSRFPWLSAAINPPEDPPCPRT